MKITILLAGLGMAAAAVPATAIAAPNHGYGFHQQGWQNINARQQRIKNRISAGINTGALTRREADQVMTRFRKLANIEARYRQTGGLQPWERRDLDNRFTALENSIRRQKNDRQDRRGAYRR